MERLSVDTSPTTETEGGASRRSLSDALGTANLSLNRYRVSTGERMSLSRHAHTRQEEVFVVLAGEATFETRDSEVAVGEREAIRFGPGEFQRGRNDADEDLLVLALGAPREAGATLVSWTPELGEVGCPSCGRDAMRVDATEDGPVLVCPDCGTEWDPN
ncbi:cupin domain-containing protein [Haloarchaeobius iranensis]|uniref:Cupin domain-containing protein n=1 Tax=Haloarchaeobius iranensis TaxID=996166 RepID=A0A1G9TUC0_9EURY|nr:cupin domain-containing protein [Haloarchaeobius iranensis]SDM50835.1 Cupin domain-containing protein [Haloarchaeobius iranensis]